MTNDTPKPIHVSTTDNDVAFYFVVRKYTSCLPATVYSPYYAFGDFLWRLQLNPRGTTTTSDEISIYLECGGPSDPESKITQWSCATRFYFTLVHPARWQNLGITDDSKVNSALIENPDTCADVDIDVPYDLEIVRQETFSSEFPTVSGEDEFAPHAILQPGMFANDNFDLVVRVRLFVNDSWNQNKHFASVQGSIGYNSRLSVPEEASIIHSQDLNQIDGSVANEDTKSNKESQGKKFSVAKIFSCLKPQEDKNEKPEVNKDE